MPPVPHRSLLASLLPTCLALGLLPSAGLRSQTPTPFAERFEAIKTGATKEQLYRFLYDLPKGGDLHHHLAGAGFGEDWYAIGTDPARNGGNRFYTRTRLAHYQEESGAEPAILFKTIQKSAYDALPESLRADYEPLDKLDDAARGQWLSSIVLDKPGEGRDEFFEVMWPRLSGLYHDVNIVAELMVQNMKHFGAEGVRYIEAQAALYGFVDHDGNVITPEQAVAVYKERMSREDAKATGVTVRFQHTILRFRTEAEMDLEDTYAFIDKHRDLFVGINLAGREDRQKGNPLRFLETFRKMRRRYSNIALSIHAGEVDEADHHVRETLLLGATRIGHGVNLIKDPETMLLMRNSQFLVEINLISNRLLEYVPDLATHPFPEYMRFGIPTCLNTDDRGMWGSDMTDEYFTAVPLYNLTWPEVVQLGRNSLAYSFVQPEEKARLLEDYNARVAAFERKYSSPDWTAALPSEVPRTFYARRTFFP